MTPKDVVITSAPGQAELATFLKGKMETEKLTVYCNTELEAAATRRVAKALVDCKVFVFVVGKESAASTLAADAVALAYISNTPMLIAANDDRAAVLAKMNFGMKLTLQKMDWHIFPSDNLDSTLPTFMGELKSSLSGEDVKNTTEQDTSAATNRRQLYAHSKQKSNYEKVDEHGNFWDRNFGSEESVAWFKFQQAFLSEYETNISESFNDSQVHWLLDMLRDEVFEASETQTATKERFLEVRGESEHKGHFWKVVSEIATEKYSMNEVFNMESTVRLTAVENLGKFQSPAVVDALLKLLDDPDPNIRAIAAISLGRTGTKEKKVINRLLTLLDDKDRICRQSACLSLGHIKAEEGVPKISHIWRNDFISTVREAAKTALEQIGGPDAERILRVTNILQEEIAQLEGKK